jgi:hypothetical protein
MRTVENSLFGIVTSVRSAVRMRVERRPMSSTVPSCCPTLQASPTRTGRSAITEKPPKRFSSVFCAASATAKAPTPRPPRSAATLKPRLWIRLTPAISATKTFVTRRPSGTRVPAAEAS